MIKVAISTPEKQKTVIVSDRKTLLELLEEERIDYAGANVLIDGMPVSEADIIMPIWKKARTDNCTVSVKRIQRQTFNCQERINALMSDVERYRELLRDAKDALDAADTELNQALENAGTEESI